MKKVLVAAVFYILYFFNICLAQNSKYEFRGVWIATIGGIDWPKPSSRASVLTQQNELIAMLDSFKSLGINAIVFQVRPTSDAFYQSSYEPWSFYLNGTTGIAPEPFYDPLSFIIEEAHQRNMELHAWFNPFRALVDSRKNPNPRNHYTWLHPEWCVNYGGKRYIDPGIPAARNYVVEVVKEVVQKYDIDAVHMDDYFYPYKVGNLQFPDFTSFNIYGRDYTDKGDWRRNNVNVFVEQLSRVIKLIKPKVKFGISPFGIYRNYPKDPDGSLTNGASNYDDLYADILLWLRKGWIDYVMPQIYWDRGHKNANYSTLLQWWSDHVYGKHLYIGHAVYRIGTEKTPAWQSAAELRGQIEDNRLMKNVHGSCLYSANPVLRNNRNLKADVRAVFTKPALIAPMPWLDAIAPKQPIVKRTGDLVKVLCDDLSCERIIIYSCAKGEKMVADGNTIDAVIRYNKLGISYLVDSRKEYVITSCDRMGNESKPIFL